VTDPRSSPRFDGRHPGRRNTQREQRSRYRHRRDDETTLSLNVNSGSPRGDPAGSGDRGPFVAACRQPRGLPRGVDAANLRRNRGDTGQAEDEDRDQSGDAERRFNGGRTGIVG
jgi:hypothetical protein